MNQRELDEIEQFLATVQKVSLYDWLEASPDAEPHELDVLLKRKRAWAQGQQANPMHRDEAQFVIRNYALLNRVFVTETDEWRLYVHESLIARAIETLIDLARVHVVGGTLPEADEKAVLDRARTLGLDTDVVRWRLEEAVREMGASREGADERITEVPVLPPDDYYERLELPHDADERAIEAAYLDRTRWAASLPTPEQASIYLHAVEEAWETLSDPERRSAYDIARAQLALTAQEAAHREALLTAVRSHSQPRAQLVAPSSRKAQPPVLAVDVRRIQLRVADKPIRGSVVVRNDGRGRMPGIVRGDVAWLRVPRPQLDPHAGRQEIAFEVATSELRWGMNRALLVIDGDHGQQVTVNVEVHRFPLARLARRAILSVAWSAAVLLLSDGAIEYVRAHNPGTVTLRVDPWADHVLVDGEDLGAGDTFEVEARTVNAPMSLVVQAHGFKDHTEVLTARRASTSAREVQLELADTMQFSPPAEPPAPLASWSTELEEAAPRFTRCVPRGGTVKAKATVTHTGEVRQLDVGEASFDVEAARSCLLRTARALRLTPGKGWGRVEWTLRIPASDT